MVSVVTSTTCSQTDTGIPVTNLPNTGFSLTSVNLVGTANVSGRESAVLIEGVNLSGIADTSALEARISTVSVITTDLSKVPFGFFYPISVESNSTLARFHPRSNVVTQTGSTGLVATVITAPVSVSVEFPIFSGTSASNAQIGSVTFAPGSNNATVSVTTSTTVSGVDSDDQFIEVRAGSLSDTVAGLSFTLLLRRL